MGKAGEKRRKKPVEVKEAVKNGSSVEVKENSPVKAKPKDKEQIKAKRELKKKTKTKKDGEREGGDKGEDEGELGLDIMEELLDNAENFDEMSECADKAGEKRRKKPVEVKEAVKNGSSVEVKE